MLLLLCNNKKAFSLLFISKRNHYSTPIHIQILIFILVVQCPLVMWLGICVLWKHNQINYTFFPALSQSFEANYGNVSSDVHFIQSEILFVCGTFV